MLIGLLGMICLVIAWIPEILDTIKRKGKGIDTKFAILTTFGDILLTIYSFQIGDPIFMALNSILLVMVLIEDYFVFTKRKKK